MVVEHHAVKVEGGGGVVTLLCLCNSVRQSYPDEAHDINDREQEIMKMWDTLTVSGWFWFLWPPCIADADILFCSCGFYFSSFLFFLAYSQQLQSGCLPYT